MVNLSKQSELWLIVPNKYYILLSFNLRYHIMYPVELTLSAPMAILRFMQTIQVQGRQVVTSCVNWNKHVCLLVIQIVHSFLFTWDMVTPDLEHGIVYFNQSGATRVKQSKFWLTESSSFPEDYPQLHRHAYRNIINITYT